MEARGITSGHLFLATDSASIIREAAGTGGGRRAFRISYLDLQRDKYEPIAMPGTGSLHRHRQRQTRNIEDVLPRANASSRGGTVVLETLLDLLLLSRASLIAGGMTGNMPRLALNLCVRPPNITHYVSLDGYHWCAESSCKPTVWPESAYQRRHTRSEAAAWRQRSQQT